MFCDQKTFKMMTTKIKKIAIRRDGISPDLKVNDRQLQTASLVYIFDGIILSVNASKYIVRDIDNY